MQMFAKERERKRRKIFGDGKLMMTPTDQPNNWVNIEQSAFFKRKTEDRDLQYSEKENVIPDKQTEFPFSDSTASVEGGE